MLASSSAGNLYRDTIQPPSYRFNFDAYFVTISIYLLKQYNVRSSLFATILAFSDYGDSPVGLLGSAPNDFSDSRTVDPCSVFTIYKVEALYEMRDRAACPGSLSIDEIRARNTRV